VRLAALHDSAWGAATMGCVDFRSVGPRFRRLLAFTGILATSSCAGCGGGTSAQIQPPPPQADFSITFSPASVDINQGTTSPPIEVSIQPVNGFSGSVQVSLEGLPSGVVANLPSPFTVQAGSSSTLFLGASQAAAKGNASVTAQGTNGNLRHSATLSLTVQGSVAPAVSRTIYIRTDSIAALDQPSDEPHRRHLVYDALNHHVFIANTAANRVEVLSSQDGSHVAKIDVPGASSVDLSPDGTIVYVGTLTEQIAGIDTANLQRTRTWSVTGLTPTPATVFDRPEEVIALSSGRALVRLRQANGPTALLALWDPATNMLTDLTSSQPQLFQNGVGVIARSADESRILVTSNDISGEAAVFDGNGNVLVSAKTVGVGSILFGAANQNGSQSAVILRSGSSDLVLLLDSALNTVTTHLSAESRGITFSRDGTELIVADTQNGNSLIQILSATDLHVIGQFVDLSIQGMASVVEDDDETGFVFGLNNRGVALLDTSSAVTPQPQLPLFANAPAVLPSTGPNTGGTNVTLSGQNFGSNPTIAFGAQLASSITANSVTQIQVTTPANVLSGAVNVSVYFSNGSLAVAPDAFSYGPQILRVLPNAGNSSGGDAVAIYGYGFGEDASKVSVKFGQSTGAVQKIDDEPAFAPSLGLDSTYPFPVQRITATSPAGSAGIADLSVDAPSGTTTFTGAFQYLKTIQVYPQTGVYKFLSYDQKRDRLYLSDIDHIDTFDLSGGFFTTTILPPRGVQPNNLIRQTVLTPDSSQLAVADFGAQSIYLIDPDTTAGSKVFVGGLPGNSNSGPVRIAPTSAQTLFVGLTAGSGTPSTCGTCLEQMNLADSPITVQPAPQPDVSLLTSAPLLDATADGSAAFFAFATAPAQPMARWNATAPQQFTVTPTSRALDDLAVAADGTAIAARIGTGFEIRDQNLALRSVTASSELESVPQRTNVAGIALHPSGALLYVPFLTALAPASPPFTGLQAGIDIFDANTGRLRLRVMLPEPFSMTAADSDGLHGKFLTIDESGQRLFGLTASGLTVIQLAQVPLGFGTITPASGSSGSSTALTIRGSGFQSGVAVMLGGKSAPASFVDMNTVKVTMPASLNSGPQRLTITNPGGESISVDGVFSVN
jgi:hypothetical protein